MVPEVKTKWIGDAGERVVVSGTVVHSERVATEYGNSTRLKITNSEGVMAWWLWSHDEAEQWPVGTPITVRATIQRYVQIKDTLWVQITNGRVETDALALV